MYRFWKYTVKEKRTVAFSITYCKKCGSNFMFYIIEHQHSKYWSRSW